MMISRVIIQHTFWWCCWGSPWGFIHRARSFHHTALLKDERKVPLTHWGLVTSYGDNDIGQHWLRLWFAAWRHQAITWTNVYLRIMVSNHTSFVDVSTNTLSKICIWKYFFTDFEHLPGANGVNHIIYGDACSKSVSHHDLEKASLLRKEFLVSIDITWFLHVKNLRCHHIFSGNSLTFHNLITYDMPQNTIKLTRNVLIMSKHLCTCQQAKLLVKMPGSIFCSIISHIRKTASINLPLSWMSSSSCLHIAQSTRTPASALSWRCLFAQSTHSSCDNEFCGCLRCVPRWELSHSCCCEDRSNAWNIWINS